MAETAGFEPAEPFGLGSLARIWFEPLTHVSKLLVNGGSGEIRTHGDD